MRAFIGIILLFLVSCAYQTPQLSPNAAPDKRAAILYGRFTVRLHYAQGNKLALWLENLDSRQAAYLFFSEEKPLYAMQIKPGNYRICGFAVTDRLHQIIERREFKPAEVTGRISRSFVVPAGSETYLGDFAGEIVGEGFYQHLKITPVTNNFTTTTVEFRRAFPNLMTVPARSVFEMQPELP